MFEIYSDSKTSGKNHRYKSLKTFSMPKFKTLKWYLTYQYKSINYFVIIPFSR